jgi:hypothetical protein
MKVTKAMSDLYAIGLIGALLLGGSFVLSNTALKIRSVNAGILGGVIEGAPIPHEFGRQTIWRVQLPVIISTGAVALLTASVLWAVAGAVENASIATLAQTCAFFFLSLSVFFLVSAPVSFAALLRMHRELGSN